jgi:hypothetical protein
VSAGTCSVCGEALGFGSVGRVCGPCLSDGLPAARAKDASAASPVVVRPRRVVALPADTDKRLERVASTRAALLAARGAYSEAVLAASAAGVTQRRIAAAAGVTQQTIQLLLSKERES